MSAEMELRAKAARIAGQAELKDVRTRALHADMEFPPAPGDRLGYDMKADFQFAPAENEGEVSVVQGHYEIDMWVSVDGEDTSGESFAKVSFVLVALFDVPPQREGAEPYSDEEWEAFARTTAQFALYPYAREHAAMLTTRLGVPPLTLGMLRLGLERDEVAELGAGGGHAAD